MTWVRRWPMWRAVEELLESDWVIRDTDYDTLAVENEALKAELAALRARVMVVPERKSSGNPDDWEQGWNACLDELARLNGKTVSEGLLRRIVVEPAGGSVYDAIAELRTLLGEGKG
ncbi:hypothetical protein D9M69_397010 [compost metagenome]